MSPNLARVVRTAMRAAGTAGARGIAIITRPAPPPDPLTGVASGAPASQSVPVIDSGLARVRNYPGAAWSDAHVVLFCDAAALTFPLMVGHTVTFAGRAGRITALMPFAPAGHDIAYDLAVGA